MPPKSEDRQRKNAEVAAFVRQLYELGGFESWGEFAREAGVLSSSISDWHRGENSPSGYNLLLLIQRATKRNADALAEAAGRSTAPAAIVRRLEAIEASLAETQTLVAQGFSAIERELRDGLRRGEDPPGDRVHENGS